MVSHGLGRGPPAQLRGRAAGARVPPRVCAAAYCPRGVRPGPERGAAARERLPFPMDISLQHFLNVVFPEFIQFRHKFLPA